MTEHGVIACKDLWMVFGGGARRQLQEVQGSNGPPGDVANKLLANGLIPAVCGVSFEVAAGELFVVMGLSGSGKSTVVRCISRLLEPTSGSVLMDGEDIIAAPENRMIELRRRKMGMVFQHFGLFPHMTVAENVAYPLKVQGVPAGDRMARVTEVIHLVGLTGRDEAYPRELSGGQRQRVGIARSLAVNPEIWFLDEPFSALDPLIRRQLQDEFLRLQADLKKSIVFITHDIAEALKLADRIAIMRNGEIVQLGTPAEIVLKPASDYVAQFTRDIPRGRMMTVETIMSVPGPVPGPVSGPVSGSMSGPVSGPGSASIPAPADKAAPALSAQMSLADALVIFARGLGDLPVTDGDGKVVGQVTPDALVRALGAGAE